jgi:hypothetical protein
LCWEPRKLIWYKGKKSNAKARGRYDLPHAATRRRREEERERGRGGEERGAIECEDEDGLEIRREEILPE